jgi:hypothetical protein
LLISFALDLPNCMTREPPPCIWFMKNRNTAMIRMIGTSVSSRLTSQLCWGTLTSHDCGGGFSSSAVRIRSCWPSR